MSKKLRKTSRKTETEVQLWTEAGQKLPGNSVLDEAKLYWINPDTGKVVARNMFRVNTSLIRFDHDVRSWASVWMGDIARLDIHVKRLQKAKLLLDQRWQDFNDMVNKLPCGVYPLSNEKSDASYFKYAEISMSRYRHDRDSKTISFSSKSLAHLPVRQRPIVVTNPFLLELEAMWERLSQRSQRFRRFQHVVLELIAKKLSTMIIPHDSVYVEIAGDGFTFKKPTHMMSHSYNPYEPCQYWECDKVGIHRINL